MSAWRPIQALETRLASAKAAISRYSSGLRFTERRCVDGISRREGRVYQWCARCSTSMQAYEERRALSTLRFRRQAAGGSLSSPHALRQAREPHSATCHGTVIVGVVFLLVASFPAAVCWLGFALPDSNLE